MIPHLFPKRNVCDHNGIVTQDTWTGTKQRTVLEGHRSKEFHPTNSSCHFFLHLLKESSVVLIHLIHVWLLHQPNKGHLTWIESLQ